MLFKIKLNGSIKYDIDAKLMLNKNSRCVPKD
jgi:hypothetical protein